MTINWYEGFFDKLYIEWQNSSEVNYQKKCFLDAQNIYNLLNISQEEKILDLCCGCGFHSSQFADLGNSVVGIDLSKEMISTAKKNFNNKKIKFISQDIRTEINNYKFDIAFCLNTSIGYFEDNIDLIKVFDNVYRCLNTKGKFVVDLFNPFKFCKEFIQHLSFNIDNFRIEQYSNLDLIKQEVTNTWEIINIKENKKVDKRNMAIKFFTPKDIFNIGEKGGFIVQGVFGGFRGEEFNMESDRLLVVFQKNNDNLANIKI